MTDTSRLSLRNPEICLNKQGFTTQTCARVTGLVLRNRESHRRDARLLLVKGPSVRFLEINYELRPGLTAVSTMMLLPQVNRSLIENVKRPELHIPSRRRSAA